MSTEMQPSADAASGIDGLDNVLGGGFARECVFLIEGSPGTGKTTLGLQFLLAGAAAGERGLYVTLSETEVELRDSAASHGWSLGEQIEVFELVPPESLLDPDQQQTLLYSSDLELGETTRRILEAFDRVKPQPRRARHPVGIPPAGAKLAALSAADSGAEALFRAQQHDRPDARRSDGRYARQDGAERRARRAPARGAGAGLRRRAAAAAGHQVSRPAHSAAAITTSSSSTGGSRSFRAWSRPSTGAASRATMQSSGIGPLDTLLGGGLGARLERADPGAGGYRQVAARAAVRRRPPSARGERRRCSSSTRSSACCSTAPRAWARHRGDASTPGGCRSSRSTQPSCRRASSRTASARCVENSRRRHGRDRQPQRLPGGDARGAVR